MQKLLFTKEGLQIMRSKQSDPTRQQGQVSIRSKCLRMQSLSSQYNVYEHQPQKHIQFVNSLKFDASSTFHTSKAQSYKHSIIALTGIITKKQQRNIIDGSKSSPLTANYRKRWDCKTSTQSIRLRLGDWFQWKNMPLQQNVVGDFLKQLKYSFTIY